MSASSAATLAKWCFTAGWLLMAGLIAAWRLLAWPDWVGVAITLLIAYGGFRLIDHIAASRT